MDLGLTETFEVWGLPKKIREGYSIIMLQTCDTLDEAQTWLNKVAPELGGYTLEVVRNRVTRQLMAAP